MRRKAASHMDVTTGKGAKIWRRWLLVAAACVVVVAAFVLYWFQPQKLFIDDRVNEAVPAQPLELARGEFESLEHKTNGVTRVLKLDDGSRVVRLEGFDTSNGPDLYLYLSTNPASGEEQAFDDDYVSLGRLKGNSGDQNYSLPADADLERFESVVVWCDRFNAAFGAADLTAT